MFEGFPDWEDLGGKTRLYHLLVWHLLQPYFWLCVLPLIALVYVWRRLPERRGILVIPFLAQMALVLFSMPIIAWLGAGTLEWPFPPLSQRPADAQAIVVLASYVRPPKPLQPIPEMDEATVYRCIQAADMYRQGKPCPVLISGGRADPSEAGPSCAEVMRDFLLQLSVDPANLIIEGHSRSTYENALESGKLLHARGFHRIILVTSAEHLARAVGCFRKQGLEVIPCGCRYRALQLEEIPLQWIPNPSSARANQALCHEWVGFLWYWLRGQI